MWFSHDSSCTRPRHMDQLRAMHQCPVQGMFRRATTGTSSHSAEDVCGRLPNLPAYVCTRKVGGEEGTEDLKRPYTFSRVASADFFMRFRPKSPPDSRCRSAANGKRHWPNSVYKGHGSAANKPSHIIKTCNSGEGNSPGCRPPTQPSMAAGTVSCRAYPRKIAWRLKLCLAQPGG